MCVNCVIADFFAAETLRLGSGQAPRAPRTTSISSSHRTTTPNFSLESVSEIGFKVNWRGSLLRRVQACLAELSVVSQFRS